VTQDQGKITFLTFKIAHRRVGRAGTNFEWLFISRKVVTCNAIKWQNGEPFNKENTSKPLLKLSPPFTPHSLTASPPPLKGPKREIFGLGIFAQIRPIWIGYLRTRPKNPKKLRLGPYIALYFPRFLC
jgi:hypothetical protein